MEYIGAARSACETYTSLCTWAGFGGQAPHSASKHARLNVNIFHGNTPGTKLTVWSYVVPPIIMENPILSGRNSWLRYNPRVYRKLLKPHEEVLILGEMTLRVDYHTGA